MNALDKIAEDEMREWLIECFEDEYDQETIEELTYEELKKAVNKYYDGGFNSLLTCMLWEEVEV